MGGTCDTNASNSEIAAAVLTIPQKLSSGSIAGTINYEYHYHVSSCGCTGRYQDAGAEWTDDPDNNVATGRTHWSCSRCGHRITSFSNYGGDPCKMQTCGYVQGQLIGATVTF